jgi:hypothetical protein
MSICGSYPAQVIHPFFPPVTVPSVFLGSCRTQYCPEAGIYLEREIFF